MDALRATTADTEDEIRGRNPRDMQDDDALTRCPLDPSGSRRDDPHEAALALLREDTRDWWTDTLVRDTDELDEGEEPTAAF